MSAYRTKSGIKYSGMFTLLLFVLLLSLFKPAGVEDIAYLKPFDYVLSIGQFLAVPVAIWLYKDHVISRFIVAVVLLFLTLLFFSLLQDGGIELGTQFFNWMKILIGCLLLEGCLEKDRIIPFMKACYMACLLILAMNLVMTFVINPNGIYSNFLDDLRGECFYGDKNSVRNPALMGFAAACVIDCLEKKKSSKQSVAILILGVVSVALVGSATSLVIFIVICIFYSTIVFRSYLPDIRIVAALVTMFWMLVVFVRKISFIEGFVVNTLHRDMTFSGRTDIWDAIIPRIIENPLLGRGLNAQIPVAWNVGYVTHAHDYYLDILFKGGLAAFFIQIYMFVISLRELYKTKSNNISKIIALLVLCFAFAGIFGSLNNPCFFMMLCLASNAGQVISLSDTECSRAK